MRRIGLIVILGAGVASGGEFADFHLILLWNNKQDADHHDEDNF